MTNRKILVSAFKKARGIRTKLQEWKDQGFNISEPKSKEKLIEVLAENRAASEGGTPLQYIPGQVFYVEKMAQYSQMSPEELLETCYRELEPNFLSEDEMIAQLSKIS
jgi:uncharacterized protein YcgL (UPF0745 family)